MRNMSRWGIIAVADHFRLAAILMQLLAIFEREPPVTAYELHLGSQQSAIPSYLRPQSSARIDHVLHADNLNPLCRPTDGIQLIHETISKAGLELKQGIPKQYDHIINAAISNRQANGDKPVTFAREILSAIVNPEVLSIVQADIAERAKQLQGQFLGESIGSYTDPRGLLQIREHIADFLWKRDYVQTNTSHIFLANGDLEAIDDIFDLIWNRFDEKMRGILLPTPGRLPTALDIARCEALCINFYKLNKDTGWTITEAALQLAYDEQRKYCVPSAIFVSSPADPTGHLLSRSELEIVVNFADKNTLIIIADESHQDEIIDPTLEFVSMRKVAADLGKLVEVVSIANAAQGPLGELGLRGGFYEFFYFDSAVVDLAVEVARYKKFCPNTVGQVAVDCMVKPPVQGDSSFDRWNAERTHFQARLRFNADFVVDRLKSVEGLEAQSPQAGVLIGIKLDLPEQFIQLAKSVNLSPSLLYVLEFIRLMGVVTLPGVMFQHPEDIFIIGISLLLESKDISEVLTRLELFQKHIVEEYSPPPVVETYLERS